MRNFQEGYSQRMNTATLCTATVSQDMIRWRDIEVDDISATGITFYTSKAYRIGQILKFDLKVYCMLTQFDVPFEGRIVEQKKLADGFCYIVKYEKIEEHVKIQLDEIFRANIATKNTSEVITADGVYSFMLNPRGRALRG